jgi:hypothetical protein
MIKANPYQITSWLNKYHSHQVKFDPYAVQRTGYMPSSSNMFLLGESHSSTILSMSFNNAVILASLGEKAMYSMRNDHKKMGFLRVSFKDHGDMTPLNLTLSSQVEKFISLDKESNSACLLDLKFNKDPDERLISILGNYLEEVDANPQVLKGPETFESMIVIRGKQYDCNIEKIVNTSFKIRINEYAEELAGERALLLIRYSGVNGIHEMVGSMDNTYIKDNNGGLSINFTLDRAYQAPSFIENFERIKKMIA